MSCWYRLYAVLAFVCCISGILIGLFGLILIADQLVWWLSEAEWRDASMLKWVGPTDTGFKGLDLILNRVLDFLPVGVAFLSGGVILYGYGRWCADHDHWRGDTIARGNAGAAASNAEMYTPIARPTATLGGYSQGCDFPLPGPT
jgi:hypothetical protein